VGRCSAQLSLAINLCPTAHTNLQTYSFSTVLPHPPPYPPPPPAPRLFWSDDERFLKQFKSGNLKTKFKSYSKFPPCFKDMAFWVSPEFTENNLCELVRGKQHH
jgi:hypothetical protein